MVANNVKHVFTVTGGGAMHLNDAFGHTPKLKCIYNHHEQACAIAAEGYTRLTGDLAAVCVTSGPGGTNAVTGVLGGWLDSIPMFVISGQVKRETTLWSTDIPLRQLGDQEYNIVDLVRSMTKYAQMITEPKEIRYHLEKAFYLCKTGRGGPVWLDVPLDVQAALVEADDLEGFNPDELEKAECPVYNTQLTEEIIAKIQKAKKPVVLAGTGIHLANARKQLIQFVEKYNIPLLTAWNADDLIWEEHPLYCGRPGTVGTRGGNFVVQNCDLLIVLGCRMNIRIISYNYKEFAKDAYKIIVDIDENELKKPTIKADLPVCADVKVVLEELLKHDAEKNYSNREKWNSWCREINQKYPAALPQYYENPQVLNPYVFIAELSKYLSEDEDVICGNGGACVITFQAIQAKKNQRIFTNSGCAAMGYGFPAAIGAAVARQGKRIVCIDGDGSFQMNLQELQTVVYNHLNLKIIYLNNSGYLSIRQTQTNLFKGDLVGVSDGNGISFPDAEKIAYAYGIPFVRVQSLQDMNKIPEMLEENGPVFCEVVVDPNQNFEPKLSSKVLPDGQIVSPPIDDMYPFLSREEYEANRFEG